MAEVTTTFHGGPPRRKLQFVGDELRQPVAIRVQRPYTSLKELLDAESESIHPTSVVLIGAAPRDKGVILTFDLVLRDGTVVLSGEGRVVGQRRVPPRNQEGMVVRFTRLTRESKAVIDQVTAWRTRQLRAQTPDEALTPYAPLAEPRSRPSQAPPPRRAEAFESDSYGIEQRPRALGEPRESLQTLLEDDLGTGTGESAAYRYTNESDGHTSRVDTRETAAASAELPRLNQTDYELSTDTSVDEFAVDTTVSRDPPSMSDSGPNRASGGAPLALGAPLADDAGIGNLIDDAEDPDASDVAVIDTDANLPALASDSTAFEAGASALEISTDEELAVKLSSEPPPPPARRPSGERAVASPISPPTDRDAYLDRLRERMSTMSEDRMREILRRSS